MTPAAKQYGTPQFLNWRSFVAPGIIQLADRAFLTAYEYWGPDQEFADDIHMQSLANHLNQILAKLSSGWVVQSEAIRVPVCVPPTTAQYPDPTLQVLAEEREAVYANAGTLYKTRLVLTIAWLPPSDIGRKFSHFFFGKRRVGKKRSRLVLLSMFHQEVQQIVTALGHFLKLQQLTDDELKKFLYHCLTGEDKKVGTSARGGMLNYALGAVTVEPWRGLVERQHVRAIGVYGFPRGTFPQLLDGLLQFPFPLRLSQRFIFLGARKAVKELERQRNKWGYTKWYNPKWLGWNATKNISGADANSKAVVAVNTDAENQVESIEREITKQQEGKVRGGWYTLVVILRDTDEERVEAHAGHVMQFLQHLGFQSVSETDNFPDAFKGSLPVHATSNVRKPRLTTDHLVRLLPTSTPWRGHEQHPSPLYPKNSGPLLICKSTGHTPFFFTPRLHSLVIGPTGNGKTTLLNMMALAQFQYPNGQVFTFDKEAGGLVPCLATGGEYFDLDAQRYAPLAHIHEETEYAWALDFCERLVKLREVPLVPQSRIDLQRALKDLAKAPVPHRTMTGLLGQLQTSDAGLKAAIGYYAGSNPGSILDGQYQPISQSRWLNFDMDQVQKRSEAVRVPVLLAQFHELDRRMVNGYASQMHVDEGWAAAGEVLLRDFIEAGSATLRKKVVSMSLVLHSPGDLDAFPFASRLINNIGTYIFLPNEMADTPAMRPHYQALGLGRREITKLATEMVPRRDYFVVEGRERRVFQLPWGDMAGALLGIDGRLVKQRVLELRQQYGEAWVASWLQERSHSELAEQLKQRGQIQNAA